MRVIQVTGTPVGKSALVPKPRGERKGKQRGAWTETGEEAEERVARKRQRLVDACRHLVAGRRGLVITYKSIENDFEGIAGVEVAHFSAIEGIDLWKDVDVVVIIGRPLPGRRISNGWRPRLPANRSSMKPRSSRIANILRPAGREYHHMPDLC